MPRSGERTGISLYPADEPIFQQEDAKIKVPNAFQVMFGREFVAADWIARHEPTVVPARTLLSQLL
jgi:hypothetical protein